METQDTAAPVITIEPTTEERIARLGGFLGYDTERLAITRDEHRMRELDHGGPITGSGKTTRLLFEALVAIEAGLTVGIASEHSANVARLHAETLASWCKSLGFPVQRIRRLGWSHDGDFGRKCAMELQGQEGAPNWPALVFIDGPHRPCTLDEVLTMRRLRTQIEQALGHQRPGEVVAIAMIAPGQHIVNLIRPGAEGEQPVIEEAAEVAP